MQRRMVDTAHSSNAPQWEDLAAHGLAFHRCTARSPARPSTTSRRADRCQLRNGQRQALARDGDSV